MAKGRELKGRIKSVENTRKITRTMEMVATSKMKRAQDRVVAARPYAIALGEVLSHLYSPELAERFPLLRQPARQRRVARRAADVQPRAGRRVQREPHQGGARARRRARGARRRRSTCTSSAARASATSSYVSRAMLPQRTDITDRPTRRGRGVAGGRPDGRFHRGHAGRASTSSTRSSTAALSTPPTTTQVLPVQPPARTEGAVQRDYHARSVGRGDPDRAAAVVRAQQRSTARSRRRPPPNRAPAGPR